jgi:hypothetical protein
MARNAHNEHANLTSHTEYALNAVNQGVTALGIKGSSTPPPPPLSPPTSHLPPPPAPIRPNP